VTDKKLIIHYEVVSPLIHGVFDGPDIARYVDAEMCCDDIDSLLGWMVDVSSQPADKPRVMLYSLSDFGPNSLGEISFCPFCGAETELQEAED